MTAERTKGCELHRNLDVMQLTSGTGNDGDRAREILSFSMTGRAAAGQSIWKLPMCTEGQKDRLQRKNVT
jgi:hypothetical protein